MSRDPYRYFRIEARELVDQLGAGALELEKGPADPAAVVARLLRVAHTLKGAARVVKHHQIADLAHATEDALEPVRDGAAPVTRERVDALLRIADAMTECLRVVEGGGAEAQPTPVAAVAATTTEPAARPAPRPGPPEAAPALQADRGELEALLTGLAEAHVQVARVAQGLESFGRLHAVVKHLADQAASPRGLGAPGAALKLGAAVDELRGALATLERDLTGRVERAQRELALSRDAAERLRLLPAERLFHSLERTARDAAAGTGRRVAFEGTGGAVRLEGDVLAAVGAALVQVVRNAVAHGIEAPDARATAGKDPAGRVAVSVSRRGSRVCFSCSDDGRGVDLDAVRAKAERKGMPQREARTLPTEEALRLLLRGGISTAQSVTGLSGRGVGLDLVRETAERLGGEVAIRTEAGRGTTVELVVPVLASSLEALIVEAAGQVAAIPLGATRRTVRVAADDLSRGPDGVTVAIDGASVPFVPLPPLLRAGGVGVRAAWSAVLLESGGATVALGVESLVGVDTVILRPLPELTPAHPAVLGVWFDAGGAARVVLDPAGLLAAARGAPVEVPAARARPPVLVIDDSLTTRMLEQSILESAGYEVDVAVSGEEGLVKARGRRYGLFLVDVEMPGMDGFTFIERTRADAELRETPAILVTSRASPEDRARGVAAGAIAHIEKSEFNQADLIARIRGLIG